MTEVRLDRAVDGACTLFVGRLLVFTNLTEGQARGLMEVFAPGLALEASPPRAAPPARSVGGRAGRVPSGAHREALARLR